MPDWLSIQEPDAGQRAKPSWNAFLEQGFRPLYVAGCLWAAACVALWVFAPHWLAGTLQGVFWHAHEMLWGVVATIAVGFLFTAGANWSGTRPLHGPALGALALLWVVARAGFLLPGEVAFAAASLAELLFFGWAAVALARVILRARSQRNYGLPLLVLALAAADACYLLAAWRGDYVALLPRLNAGMLCMAVIALVISRRVIPFFASRAVAGLTLPMHVDSGRWQVAAGVLAVVLHLLGSPRAMAGALAVAGVIALWQVCAWKPWRVRRVPLLWILYVGYASLGAGLILAAAHAVGWPARAAWPAHVIGMAGFSVLIIGMVTRTALGHLGRPLRADHSMVAAYLLVIAASVLRLAALPPSGLSQLALHASALAWVAAFVLYLWRFFPWLIRPRVDRPSGVRVGLAATAARRG